jgi:beta-glucosidase
VFERARALRRPVITVLFSGRPLAVPWLVEKSAALLAAWFPGSEAGNAVGDVLLGRVSPSGRTPVVWPRAEGQLPLFYGQRPSGRPADPDDRFTSKYLDESNAAMVPFGYGLSYGRFRYANLRVPRGDVAPGDTAVIRVDLTNEGPRAAEETAFLFIHRKVAAVAAPVLQLKGFAKIHLNPGDTGTVTLLLPVSELRCLGAALEPVLEPGDVEILVGPWAERSQLLAGTLRVAGAGGN